MLIAYNNYTTKIIFFQWYAHCACALVVWWHDWQMHAMPWPYTHNYYTYVRKHCMLSGCSSADTWLHELWTKSIPLRREIYPPRLIANPVIGCDVCTSCTYCWSWWHCTSSTWWIGSCWGSVAREFRTICNSGRWVATRTHPQATARVRTSAVRCATRPRELSRRNYR